MPVVPVIRPDSVQAAGLTNARVQPPQMQDGGVANALGQAGDALGNFAKMEDQRLANLDEATVRSLNNEFAQRERDILWGTADKPGALALEGQDAVVAAQAARTEIETARADIAARAQGKRQQDMLTKTLDARMAGTYDTLARQEADQTVAWNKAEASSRIVNAGDDASRAFGTPEFEAKVAALFVAQDERAAMSGFRDPETIKAGRRTAFTGVARSVVGGLLDTDPAKAVTFLQTHGDMIDKPAYDQLLDAAQKADRIASVLTEADALWAAAGGDYGKYSALAAANKDPQKRLALENRGAFLRQQHDAAQADAKGALWERLAPLMGVGGKSYEELPAADRAEADRLGISDNLISLSRTQAQASQPPPNGPAVAYLQAMSITNQDQFRAVSLFVDPKVPGSGIDPVSGKPWTQVIPPNELVDLLRAQKGLRDAVPASLKPAIEATRALTKPQFDVIFAAQPPGTRKMREGQLDAYIIGALSQRIANTNTPLKPEDYQAVASAALNKLSSDTTPYYFETKAAGLQITAPDSWKRLRDQLTVVNGGQLVGPLTMDAAITRAEKGQAIVPYGKIPKADKDRLAAIYAKKFPGQTASDRNVEQLYNNYLLGKPL